MQPATTRPTLRLLAFLSVTVFAACVGRPTAGEVVDQSAPVICEKSKECAGEGVFALAYPGGVDECVEKTKADASKKFGDDLDKSSVCTDDELAKCLDDFKTAACPADGSTPKPPCDC
jgi:hypothetical protein